MNENTLIYLLFFGIVLILIIVLIMFIFMHKQIKQKDDELKRFVKDELNTYQNNYYQNALTMSQSIADVKSALNKDLLGFQGQLQQDFNTLHDRTTNRLGVLEHNIANNLKESYKSGNEVFQKINEKIVSMDEAQKGLQELSKEIIALQSILQDKKTRGIFGELELYSLLELAYGNDEKRWAKQYKLANGNIADAVVFGSGNLGLIVIDSKFPLENYRRIYDEALDIVSREAARKAFKKDVIKHIDDISNKYIDAVETAPMAYMFIPAEGVFSEIHASLSEVVDYSYAKHVYLVSPTTLMAYLTAIRSIYLGQKKDENAKEIKEALEYLAIEFNRYLERSEKLYQDYQRLERDFELLNKTQKKIAQRFGRINSGNTSIDVEENDDES